MAQPFTLFLPTFLPAPAPAVAVQPSSVLGVLGHTKPRICTPPLRPLTPDTSFGFEVIDFARDVLKSPLDEWEELAVIHGGELLPNGQQRFRTVLIIAARRNGKTHIAKVLMLYWQFKKRIPLTVLTSNILAKAIETWEESIDLVNSCSALDDEHLPDPMWHKHGGSLGLYSYTKHGATVRVSAKTTDAGRGSNVHRAILDELRQHINNTAWDALTYAGNAVRDFQAWATTNAGSERSVVLNELRKSAIDYIETDGKEGDPTVCLLEWSCEPEDDPKNPEHLAKANPNMNRHADRGPFSDVLVGQAKAAISAGGEKLAGFKTEVMCFTVPSMDPAIDPNTWKVCAEPGRLLGVVRSLAVCLDISPGNRHATLVVAGMLADGRCRIQTLAYWEGFKAVNDMRRDLGGWLTKVKPRVLGWLPDGPAATFMADTKKLKLPPGTTLVPIQGEIAAVCMGFEEQVSAGLIAHSDDELLNDHVTAAEKLRRGSTWVFSRKGGVCEAAYAAAGAVHLARTLPTRKASTLPTPLGQQSN